MNRDLLAQLKSPPVSSRSNVTQPLPTAPASDPNQSHLPKPNMDDVAFVLQSGISQCIFITQGYSKEFQEADICLSTVRKLSCGDKISVMINSDVEECTLLFRGTVEEAQQYISTMTASGELQLVDQSAYVSVAMLQSVQQELEEVKQEVAGLRAELRTAVVKFSKKRVVSTKRSKQKVANYRIQIGAVKGTLETIMEEPTKLYEAMREHEKPVSYIIDKYHLDKRAISRLRELRSFMKQHIAHPSRCAQVAVTLFVPFDECFHYFMPGPDKIQRVRAGRTFKKRNFNTSFQSLYRDTLVWAAAFIFDKQSRNDFLLYATDGFNQRINNQNSKNQKPIDQRVIKTSYFPSMKDVDDWHDARTQLADKENIADDYGDDEDDFEATDGEYEGAEDPEAEEAEEHMEDFYE